MASLSFDPGRTSGLDGGSASRGLWRISPFATTMAIVAVLAAIYYGLIAAPMYVSETRFTIHSQQSSSAPTGLLAGLAGKGADLSDITAVQDFIQSHEMADALDKQFHIRDAYSRFRPDVTRWLRPGASDEGFLRFYRRMIEIKVDREAGIVEVDVRAFDKASAQPIANAVLQRTEAFVDGMSQRSRAGALAQAQAELTRAQEQVDEIRAQVANFRGAASSVDPKVTGTQVQGGEAAMEAQAAAAQAELASALTFNRPDAPAVRQLQAKLNAIRAQQSRLHAEQGAGGGARQVTAYEALLVSRQTAETKLAAATTAFDVARSTARQQEKYVVRVVNPSQPDRPSEPKRLIDFLTIMVFAVTGYAIVTLVIAGIRDHRGV